MRRDEYGIIGQTDINDPDYFDCGDSLIETIQKQTLSILFFIAASPMILIILLADCVWSVEV